MADDAPDEQWNIELRGEAAFIDETWLEGQKGFQIELNFSKPEEPPSRIAYEVTGFAGFGSSSVAFYAKDKASGDERVLKMTRGDWSFASYIRELPPSMTTDRAQHNERIYRKLERLFGDQMLDYIVNTYDQLYASLVSNLHDWPPFDRLKWDSEEAALVMTFGVQSPGTIAQLSRLASGATARPETADWADRTLRLLKCLEIVGRIRPESLHDNPVYVLGGALLSGFLEPAEASRRARYLLMAQPQELVVFVAQGWAIAQLLLLFKLPGASNFADFWHDACDGLEAA